MHIIFPTNIHKSWVFGASIELPISGKKATGNRDHHHPFSQVADNILTAGPSNTTLSYIQEILPLTTSQFPHFPPSI